jgi:FkbM family methyltransferase
MSIDRLINPYTVMSAVISFAGFDPLCHVSSMSMRGDHLELAVSCESPSFAYNRLGVRTRLEFMPSVEEREEREWIDVLEAVAEAADAFTMLELGAGYGRWLVNAAVALRQSKPSVAVHLIGVEAEPTHFRWMKTHFRDNGLDPEKRVLVQGAVAAHDGTVQFFSGHSRQWYGQSIARQMGLFSRIRRYLRTYDASRPWESAKIIRVRAIMLNLLLRALGFVDLIHLDVQGAEYDVLQAAATQVNDKVRRVHIATHSKEIEKELREMLSNLGWKNIHDNAVHPAVKDGAQSSLNAKF